MAPTQLERIAALEALTAVVFADVKEVKADVKTLLEHWNRTLGRNSLLAGVGKTIPWAALVAALIAIVRGG